MVEMCGSGYVMDYCISAFHKNQKEEAFRNYLADGLYAMSTQKATLTTRFYDLIHPVSKEQKAKNEKEKKEEAKRIVSNIRNK